MFSVAPCRILPCSCGMAGALEAGDDDYDAELGHHEHLQRRRTRLMRAAVGSWQPTSSQPHGLTGMARPNMASYVVQTVVAQHQALCRKQSRRMASCPICCKSSAAPRPASADICSLPLTAPQTQTPSDKAGETIVKSLVLESKTLTLTTADKTLFLVAALVAWLPPAHRQPLPCGTLVQSQPASLFR
jgi:hypothetical protein